MPLGPRCVRCGKRMSFWAYFLGKSICNDCLNKEKLVLYQIEEQIKSHRNFAFQTEQIEFVKRQSKSYRVNLYMMLYKIYEEDHELTEEEIAELKKMQDALELTDEDVRYDDLIRPYLFIRYIRATNQLPELDLVEIEGSQIVLQKNEKVHFYFPVILKEQRVVNLGYRGSSQGVSFQITKGVRYRVGTHQGRVVKQEMLVETSRGILIITNQRVLLQPFVGFKPVSIPLKKIISYQCYQDCISIYKDGREKGYFFYCPKMGYIEIAGICLGFLLGNA